MKITSRHLEKPDNFTALRIFKLLAQTNCIGGYFMKSMIVALSIMSTPVFSQDVNQQPKEKASEQNHPAEIFNIHIATIMSFSMPACENQKCTSNIKSTTIKISSAPQSNPKSWTDKDVASYSFEIQKLAYTKDSVNFIGKNDVAFSVSIKNQAVLPGSYILTTATFNIKKDDPIFLIAQKDSFLAAKNIWPSAIISEDVAPTVSGCGGSIISQRIDCYIQFKTTATISAN